MTNDFLKKSKIKGTSGVSQKWFHIARLYPARPSRPRISGAIRGRRVGGTVEIELQTCSSDTPLVVLMGISRCTNSGASEPGESVPS